MSKRLGLVIFAASGYTGRHVVAAMVRMACRFPDISWGIAGRSQKKLEEVLAQAAEKTDVSSVRIIVADITDEDSLLAMCQQTTVLVNCCGPYTQYGEAVVAAAISASTHYLDVSVENKFFMLLDTKYDKMAADVGVFVINACGLVSLPVDVGLSYFEKQFKGTLNSVECYLTPYIPDGMLKESFRNGTMRYCSWESLINNLECKAQFKNHCIIDSVAARPTVESRCSIHRRLGKWCIPFPMYDDDVIHWTRKKVFEQENKQPIKFKTYLTLSCFLFALMTLTSFMIFQAITKWPLLKRMLLKYPRFFSFGIVTNGEPANGVMDDSTIQYDLFLTGWNKEAESGKTSANLTGRVKVLVTNPPFNGTAVALLHAAITVIQERHKMPTRGGVLTPGAAFSKTNIIQRLQDDDFIYEIIG